MKTVISRTVQIALIAVLSIPGFMLAEERRIEKVFESFKEISIRTINGDLDLEPSPDDRIHVLVTHTFSPQRYQAVLEPVGDELRLSESLESGTGTGKSSWTVSVPAGAFVRFVSGAGGCRASGMDLHLKVRNASGDVVLQRMKGRFEIRTASGDFEGEEIEGDVRFNGASGDVKLTKVKGGVKVYGASSDFWGSGLIGEADVSLTSGDLVIKESQLILKAGTISGDLSVRDLNMTGACALQSASGSVLLHLGAPLAADLTLKSASGSVVLQLNGSGIDAELICSTGQDRGKITVPFSFDSQLVLEKNGVRMLENKVRIGKGLYRVFLSSVNGDVRLEK